MELVCQEPIPKSLFCKFEQGAKILREQITFPRCRYWSGFIFLGIKGGIGDLDYTGILYPYLLRQFPLKKSF